MLNPFAIEKELFTKINKIQMLTEKIKKEVSIILYNKSNALGIELSQELKEKCELYLNTNQGLKLYVCKFCAKQFDDGRKLGGHVSRAHKEEELFVEEIDESNLKGRKKRKIEKQLIEEQEEQLFEDSNQCKMEQQSGSLFQIGQQKKKK